MRIGFVPISALLFWSGVATAEVPGVVADIAPVHSLVAQVMQGVAEPDLILPPGASPHAHALRPSEAATLETADIVFRVGPELTPWLDRPLAGLAGGAEIVALLDAKGTLRRPYRWADADHAHGEADSAEAVDPHAWMDPENAAAWMQEIARVLAARDPQNAETYLSNAGAGAAELRALSEELKTSLSPLGDVRFIVYHDALHYFEEAFGLTAVGALTRGEAAPGPRHLAEMQALARRHAAACILLEPEADPGLGEAVREGSDAAVVTIDPQGRGIPTGPGFYAALLTSLADALADCL